MTAQQPGGDGTRTETSQAIAKKANRQDEESRKQEQIRNREQTVGALRNDLQAEDPFVPEAITARLPEVLNELDLEIEQLQRELALLEAERVVGNRLERIAQ